MGKKTRTDCLTSGEIAKAIKVAPRTAAKLIDSGRLPGWIIPGSRHRRVSTTVFLAFIRENMPDQLGRIKKELNLGENTYHDRPLRESSRGPARQSGGDESGRTGDEAGLAERPGE